MKAKQVELLLREAQQDGEILAAMLFGSVARGERGAQSRFFQQLPLYVRRRVLKEGIVLLVKDEDELYELAFRTAKEFEDFKHIYRNYLEAIAHG
jgi:hypothetical protein